MLLKSVDVIVAAFGGFAARTGAGQVCKGGVNVLRLTEAQNTHARFELDRYLTIDSFDKVTVILVGLRPT